MRSPQGVVLILRVRKRMPKNSVNFCLEILLARRKFWEVKAKRKCRRQRVSPQVADVGKE